MSLWIEMGRRNCLPLQPFWRVCPRKHEQVVMNFLREIRFSKLIIYGFFPPLPSSSLFDYCMFFFVATSVRSKICYRQETAVRTVAQTLGGIAVFRFPCLLFEIWFCLIRARNSSLQGDSNSLGSRNRRDPCWSLPLRSLQCKKVNERSISTWWRLCSNVWHRCARRTWPCPFCTARSSRGLPPSSVVLDLVLLLSKNLSKISQSSIPKVKCIHFPPQSFASITLNTLKVRNGHRQLHRHLDGVRGVLHQRRLPQPRPRNLPQVRMQGPHPDGGRSFNEHLVITCFFLRKANIVFIPALFPSKNHWQY